MIPSRLRSGVFLAAMLGASAACASADAVQCVDRQGRVTLTDAPCGEGIQSRLTTGPAGHAALAAPALPASGVAALSAAAVARSAIFEVSGTALPQVRQDASKALPLARVLTRDVETLKAARVSMQVLDKASAAPHP